MSKTDKSPLECTGCGETINFRKLVTIDGRTVKHHCGLVVGWVSSEKRPG